MVASMQMRTLHISDDDLEGYSLGRLDDAAVAPSEEHLLVCEACRNRLTRWDQYVRALRAAGRTVRVTPLTRGAGGCLPD